MINGKSKYYSYSNWIAPNLELSKSKGIMPAFSHSCFKSSIFTSSIKNAIPQSPPPEPENFPLPYLSAIRHNSIISFVSNWTPVITSRYCKAVLFLWMACCHKDGSFDNLIFLLFSYLYLRFLSFFEEIIAFQYPPSKHFY